MPVNLSCVGSFRSLEVVRCVSNQCLKFFACMAGSEPVGDIAAFGDFGPVLFEIESAYTLGSANRELARQLGIGISRLVVIIEYNDVGSSELRTVCCCPAFSTEDTASSGDAQGPQIVRIVFALNACNDASFGNCPCYFIGTIKDLSVDTLGAANPSIFPIGPLNPERFREGANFSECNFTAGITVIID